MRAFILFVFLLIISTSPFAQERKMRVYMDTKEFYSPGIGNLLEVNLQFVGPTLNYIGQDNGLVADVAVYLSLVQDGDTTHRDAHRLTSPLMKDSIVEDFYDTKRFVVSPGNYSLHVELMDLQSKNDPITGTMPISIKDNSTETKISNIQIAESAFRGNETSPFFKSGYEIIPRFSNFYPKELTSLPYYAEIYNSELLGTDQFAIKEAIIDLDTKEEIEEHTRFYRQTTQQVVPLFKQIDISGLSSGTYLLSLTILSKDLKEIHNVVYQFDRTNEIDLEFDQNVTVLDPAFSESISSDSTKFYLASLIPISTPSGARKILSMIKSGNEEQAQLLIQAFWNATSGKQAYQEWIKYKAQVLLVQKLYANTFQDGFESDRGRVYLQYGSPTNIVQREASASEYPYEIWMYNKIERFSNRRFVFYNPDLLGKNYSLIHSDMVGEVKNVNWPRTLNSRNSTNGDVDNGNSGVQDHYGGQSNTLYNQY